MADISKIKAINGTTYNIKDATARKVIVQGTDSAVYMLENVMDVQFKRFEAEGWVNAGHLQGGQVHTNNPVFYLPLNSSGGTLATTDDVKSTAQSVTGELWNAGSKNRCPINSISFTKKAIGETNPCHIAAGSYIFSCKCSATSSTSHLYLLDASKTEIFHQAFSNAASKSINITVPSDAYYVRFDNDYAGDNTLSDIMIRSSSISDSTYVPYAPTNRELYEMILALQS